jgi:RNA polymerase sigma factor (sigma-70 family)
VKARPESDEILVQRLLPRTNSDPQDRATAWGEWYVRQGKPYVLAFIRAKNDTTEPDMDILHEAMMTAYAQVERGRYKARAGVPFAAYVKGIAQNKIREARRRARRFISLQDLPEYLAASDQLQVEFVVERHEQQSFLRTGLSGLSQRRRRVLEGYLGGHSTSEIAHALGMSEELVRQHKSRGLRVLRRSVRQMSPAASYR